MDLHEGVQVGSGCFSYCSVSKHQGFKFDEVNEQWMTLFWDNKELSLIVEVGVFFQQGIIRLQPGLSSGGNGRKNWVSSA